MKTLNKYHGVVVPMVTPITKNNEIDIDAVKRIINNFAQYNVSALIMGTTGEGNSVSVESGVKMIKAASEAAAGRITIYAGLAGNCISEQYDAAEKFIEAGADVIAATLPCYYSLTPKQMYEYYKNLADTLTAPLMLYNITITTHMSIPLDVIEKLSHHPNIVGLKDSENNIQRMEEALTLFSDREDFAYFCGCAANSAKALSLGADGIVPSVGNYLPKIYNPQNEMFWHFRTKCSFPKTKRTSLILFMFITYNKKASKKNVFLRCFLLCYLLHNSQKITNFIAYKQGVILCCNAVLMSL